MKKALFTILVGMNISLIMENGKTVYEGYFNGASKESLPNTRSVTKTVTSMAVGAAIDEGLMKIDSPAATFLLMSCLSKIPILANLR